MKARASSVLMAELAALLVAAKVIKNLQIKNVVIATYSSEAVQQLHASQDDIFWRFRLLITNFKQTQEGSCFQVVKIDRKHNDVAHRLASQAKSGCSQNSVVLSCYNRHHQSSCAALSAFENVIILTSPVYTVLDI